MVEAPLVLILPFVSSEGLRYEVLDRRERKGTTPKPNKLGTFSTMVHCGATFFHSFYTTYLFYVRAVYEYHRQVVQYTMLTSV